MQCPVCAGVDLMMSDRNGVEIDYCPKCRGVWLDRGELDKIIERSGAGFNQTSSNSSFNKAGGYNEQRAYQQNHNGYYKKKKESWLGELFDF